MEQRKGDESVRLIAKHVLPEGSARVTAAQLLPALDCLPSELKRAILLLPESTRYRLEEIRLRTGRMASVTVGGQEKIVTRDGRLIPEDSLGRGILCPAEYVRAVVERAADGFVYSAEETIRQGFVAMRGGHRCGLAGRAVLSGGTVTSIGELGSVCLRIARDIEGVAAEGADAIIADGKLCNTLIVSPPLAGKTTYLRDLVRSLAARRLRVGVCDERCEIAAVCAGEPQFSLGQSMDVIDNCPKAEAAMILLRALAPQVIAMDEITAPGDVAAILCAANCGVAVVATAHADSTEAAMRRPIYAPLWENRVFSRVLELSAVPPRRTCAVYALDG